MRRTVDSDNVEIREILKSLIQKDITITFREVVRCHTSLKSTSDITRNTSRRNLVEESIAKQLEIRSLIAGKKPGDGRKTQTQRLQEMEAYVVLLEARISALAASHAECVRTVASLGGTKALLKFWNKFQEIEAHLIASNAVPNLDNVLDFPNKS
jgi:hypothetical protein